MAEFEKKVLSKLGAIAFTCGAVFFTSLLHNCYMPKIHDSLKNIESKLQRLEEGRK